MTDRTNQGHTMKSLLLAGDGIHDDTEAIQSLLDSGVNLIHLPPPAKHYVISKTLIMHSGQELKLDRFTRIRLAAGSNCLMLTNDDHAEGNRNISVSGGIWDYNNQEQAPNYQLAGRAHPSTPDKKVPGQLCDSNRAYSRDLYRGVAFLFVNVEHFSMTGVTFRDPVTYASQFALLRYFTIEDVTFDFRHWNPAPNNMDGIHLDGGCRFGKISNLKGTCYDDLVALNANDGLIDSPFQGPISDIEIDGIFAENCHSAVRMLSFEAPIRRIHIRNIYGTFYRYTVGITHWTGATRGIFDDILLENLFIGKALPREEDFNTPALPEYPPIFIERGGDVSRLSIRNLQRDEHTVAVPTIVIEDHVTVEYLMIHDSGCRNHLPEPFNFLVNDGTVKRLVLDGIRLAGASGETVSGSGTIHSLRSDEK